MTKKSLLFVALVLAVALPVLAADKPSATPLRDSAERIVASAALTQEDKLFYAMGVDKHNKPKSFWNTTNLFLGVGQGLALTADLETTFRDPKTTVSFLPDGTRVETTRMFIETVPWMHPMVHRGRPVAYSTKIAINGAVLVGSHYLRQSPHKGLRILGTALPVVAIGGQFGLAVHNYQLN